MRSILLRLTVLIFIAAQLSSCVSSKKIAYVQTDENYKKDFQGYDEFFKPAQDTIILETNDVISVTVNHLQLSEQENYSGLEADANARLGVRHPFLIGYPIDDNGNIDIPTIGQVNVLGLTLFEAENTIRERAKLYYPDPNVKVFLMSYFVTVLGEVNNPGRYPVYNNSITIFDALGLASDMTDLADRNDVRILRRRGGVNHLYHMNLNNDDILAMKSLYMQPDDVVLVTPLKAKKFIRRDPQTVLNTIGTAISLVTLYLLIKE